MNVQHRKNAYMVTNDNIEPVICRARGAVLQAYPGAWNQADSNDQPKSMSAGKRIAYENAFNHLSIIQVFGQQPLGTAASSGGNDQAVPERNSMLFLNL